MSYFTKEIVGVLVLRVCYSYLMPRDSYIKCKVMCVIRRKLRLLSSFAKYILGVVYATRE
jgi:hypothetical protein